MYKVFDNLSLILLDYKPGNHSLEKFIVPCEIIKETKHNVWIKLGDKLQKYPKSEFVKSKEDGFKIIIDLLKSAVEQGKKAEEILKEMKK